MQIHHSCFCLLRLDGLRSSPVKYAGKKNKPKKLKEIK